MSGFVHRFIPRAQGRCSITVYRGKSIRSRGRNEEEGDGGGQGGSSSPGPLPALGRALPQARMQGVACRALEALEAGEGAGRTERTSVEASKGTTLGTGSPRDEVTVTVTEGPS